MMSVTNETLPEPGAPDESSSGPEKGSRALSVLGFAIIAAVVVGALLLVPWSDVFKGRDTNYAAAMAAMEKKEWDKAVSLFQKSLKSQPDNAAAHLGLSKAYLHLGKQDKALEQVNAALMYEKDNALAYGQRGIVQKLKKQFDEALGDFNRAVTLKPDFAWAQAQIADILMRKQDFEEALSSANKALAIDPQFVEALSLRGRILTRMGKCKEAFQDFTLVQELRPEDAWSLQDKAWFLLTCPAESLQDTSKAMELARKAFDLSQGQDGLVQETLAEAYFRNGDPLKAAEHQKRAIELQIKKCPDGSCVKEMQKRLQKYELASRRETRPDYEILPLLP
jgi:tetratricopeptide (TPR) repeat protein